MSEKIVKVDLLDQCPDNCAAMEIATDKMYAGDECVWSKLYCENMKICAKVFESMENQQNERDHITCGECRFYMPNINKCAGFTENPNEYFEMDRDDYCSQGQPILIIPWDGDNE